MCFLQVLVVFVGSPHSRDGIPLALANRALVNDTNVNIFTVGVGSKSIPQELKEVASNPRNVFVDESVGQLGPAIVKVTEQPPVRPTLPPDLTGE